MKGILSIIILSNCVATLTAESIMWIDADPAANQMCDGCWFGSSACVGAETAYALAPVNDQANDMGISGVAISKDDARVSAAFCAEQMKNEPDCSKQFIGVSKKNGQCWCAKENDDCEKFVGLTSYIGYFFQKKEGSEKISEGRSEQVFEGAIEVGSARRLNTASFESHDELKDAVANWLKKSPAPDGFDSRQKYGMIRDWDVSLVDDMSNIFRFASSFNGNVSKWDVSKATDMSAMFRGAETFNNDISEWDVSNVVIMSRTFDGAVSFNGDISQWDVSRVIYMIETFCAAKSFNGDISKWDVSSVNYMTWMFYGAESFNVDISNWDVSIVVDMSHMFYNAVSFNVDVSKWDVSQVNDMSKMFFDAKSFNRILGGEAWVTSSATKDLMFSGSSGSISTTITFESRDELKSVVDGCLDPVSESTDMDLSR